VRIDSNLPLIIASDLITSLVKGNSILLIIIYAQVLQHSSNSSASPLNKIEKNIVGINEGSGKAESLVAAEIFKYRCTLVDGLFLSNFTKEAGHVHYPS